MKKLITILAAVLTATAIATVAVPSTALAASYHPQNQGLIAQQTSVGLPIFRVDSNSFRPFGFRDTAGQAIAAAEANKQMDAIHAREHPLTVIPRYWVNKSWLIDFFHGTTEAAEVVVDKRGQVTGVWTGPLAIAPYARGDFAPEFGRMWLLLPFSLLFLLPFLDVRRWRRIVHLDALVALSFLVSYLLFDHAKLVPAVWLVYPPLIYLMGRMLWIGFGRTRQASSTALSPLLSVRALAIGLAVLVVARIVISLLNAGVVDVGYASVVGAHDIATGHSIYAVNGIAEHGNTYGPIAYLAYLPFELIFPWHGGWDYLPAAHAASLTFDLVTILGLVLLGRRLRTGREGLRLGLAMGWAWAACPFTLLQLMEHSNDGLIAMLSVLSLLAFASPAGRGVLLGLAAAAKFAPAALLGLYAGDRRGGRKSVLTCIVSFVAIVVAAIGLYLPNGGLHQFYEQTIGFQLHRVDVFSPWALHPGLSPLKLVVEVLALGLCVVLAFLPRERSLAQTAALAGAVTIAVQLPAVHWFYYYIVWFVPFVLVALLADEHAPASATATVGEAAGAQSATALISVSA